MSASTKWIMDFIEKKVRAGDHLSNPAEIRLLRHIVMERSDLTDDDRHFLAYVNNCVEYQMEWSDESV